jgi:diaminopimelate epimerase
MNTIIPDSILFDGRVVPAVATGNTFLIIDFISAHVPFTKKHEVAMYQYHRQLGYERIDSCLVLERYPITPCPPSHALVFRMRVYYPEGGFCGNGARAVSHYVHREYREYSSFTLIAEDSFYHLGFDMSLGYKVQMGPTLFGKQVSRKFYDNRHGESAGDTLEVEGTLFYITQTGEPHLITLDNVDDGELERLAFQINSHRAELFPQGICVNRVQKVAHNHIRVKTWERGIDRFTLACGSGSTSCVQLLRQLSLLPSNEPVYRVQNPGGFVSITITNDQVWLAGDSVVGMLES